VRIDQVADGVWQVETLPYVNVWVVADDDSGVTLVDASVAGLHRRVVGALGRLGLDRVDRLLLTHCHSDHAGGAAELVERFRIGDVFAGAADVPHVASGEMPAADPSTLGGRVFGRLAPGVTPVPPVRAVPDRLDVAGGLLAVATPGHSPGHTAYHLPAHGIVIGGDAVFNVFRLRPSFRAFCSDVGRSHESMLTLADLAPRTLLLAHGTPVTDDVAGRLRELHARVAG
jgi:glyoxylase-like metal-dependent hydrolase (beta-lactamase superfamily II)